MPLDREPIDVTEAELSSRPDRWHLCRIRVTGTWCFQLESSAFAGCWLEPPGGAPGYGTYRVRVVGTWVYPDAGSTQGHGHMGCWPGVLQAERFEVVEKLDRGPGTPRDGLTGLFNRRALGERFAERRDRRPIAVALMDVDRLAEVNRVFGHDAGDDVLRRTAEVVAKAVRPGDIVGRWAGEEIVVLFPATPLDAAKGVIEAAVTAVRRVEVRAGEHVVRVTSSAGVVLTHGEEDLSAVVARAAEAVDAARRAGRDRVVARDT